MRLENEKKAANGLLKLIAPDMAIRHNEQENNHDIGAVMELNA